MADAQAQPSWITGLFQNILSKIGLGSGPGQPAAPDPNAPKPQNPWVSPNPNMVSAPAPLAPIPDYTAQAKIQKAQAAAAQAAADEMKKPAPKKGAPTSNLNDLFSKLLGDT